MDFKIADKGVQLCLEMAGQLVDALGDARGANVMIPGRGVEAVDLGIGELEQVVCAPLVVKGGSAYRSDDRMPEGGLRDHPAALGRPVALPGEIEARMPEALEYGGPLFPFQRDAIRPRITRGDKADVVVGQVRLGGGHPLTIHMT